MWVFQFLIKLYTNNRNLVLFLAIFREKTRSAVRRVCSAVKVLHTAVRGVSSAVKVVGLAGKSLNNQKSLNTTILLMICSSKSV